MKVKWKSIYYPIGELVDCETGKKCELSAEIRRDYCSIDGRKVIFAFINQASQSGHGEPSISANTPAYFYADTLEQAPIDSVVEISECPITLK